MIHIYGTFGPACSDPEVLKAMFRVGMTGMRLNLSHTGLRDSLPLLEAFRAAAQAARVQPELLIDLQGPELRIGTLSEPLTLAVGDTVTLGQGGIPVPACTLPAMACGDEVVLDDGKICLQVLECHEDSVTARVMRGGVLTARKSLKLKNPNAVVDMPVLTEHDLQNIALAAQCGVTGVMQPFVRSGDDLRQVRRALDACGARHVNIFAKIENRQGVAMLGDILPHADGVIIARGDLGNDMDLWMLPGVQKDIAAACRAVGKPFVVVTQMLASMEHSPAPTRAEVSDIFNAVLDGAAGVMVTGETAVGEYPEDTLRYLTNTAHAAEAWAKKGTTAL